MTTHDLIGLWSAMHGYHSAMEDEQLMLRDDGSGRYEFARPGSAPCCRTCASMSAVALLELLDVALEPCRAETVRFSVEVELGAPNSLILHRAPLAVA